MRKGRWRSQSDESSWAWAMVVRDLGIDSPGLAKVMKPALGGSGRALGCVLKTWGKGERRCSAGVHWWA